MVCISGRGYRVTAGSISEKGSTVDDVEVVPPHQSAETTSDKREPGRSHIRTRRSLQATIPVGGYHPIVCTTNNGDIKTAQ